MLSIIMLPKFTIVISWMMLATNFGGSLASINMKGIRVCTNNETVTVQVSTKPSEQGLKCLCQVNSVQEPSSIRDDYVYTPGIGAHKIYTDAKNWNDARKACLADDGHLAIINSKAEELILIEMLKKAEKSIKYALNTEQAVLGIHDLYKEGDWVTIFGEPLAATGYPHWSPVYFGGQPDNYGGNQNCGSVISVQGGGLDDVFCHDKFAYFCELPISC